MSNDKLILESLNWLLSNTQPDSPLAETQRNELFGKIYVVLNPEEAVTIADRTHDALCESSEVNGK